MEAHLQHSHGRHFDEGEIPDAGAEEEHHGEKKSVMKKVKAKAKKLKDTLTKHGHDHHDDDDDHHEDDDDVEMVEDPEVHGAPMYESSAIRSGIGPDAILGEGRGNLERPSVLAEDRYTIQSDMADTPVRSFAKWEEESQGAPPPLSTGAYPSQPSTHVDLSRVKIGHSTAMEEDPDAPKDPSSPPSHPSNYETKATDPTNSGGKEAGLAQIIHSLDKMGVNDEHESKSSNLGQRDQKLSSGSHDQFAPEPENLPHDTVTGSPSSRSSGYTEKISSATSAIADKAAAAKEAIAYKLGYSGQNKGEEVTDGTPAKSASATDYAHKIAGSLTGTLAPVYDKVVDAGSSVMAKMPGTGRVTESGQGMEKGGDKGVSVKEYLVETFRPGEEDKALSEVITSAFHRGKDGEPEKKSGEDSPAMGIVTESEEVQRRLGSDRKEGSNVSADKGVVDRLKGAVGSWLAGRGNAAPGSRGTSFVTDEGLSSSAGGDGEGKVEESGK